MISVIPDIARNGAEKFTDLPALADSRRVLSYQALWERVEMGAKQLGGGGTIALYASPGPDWIVALFAALAAGRCVFPVSHKESSEFLQTSFVHAGVEQVICSSTLCDKSPVHKTVEIETLGLNKYSGTLPEISPDYRALISFTSGSTQEPKAVLLSHNNIVANIRGLIEVQQVTSDDVFLSILPPSHLFELVVGNLAPMVLGASIHFTATPLPNRIIQALRKQGVTYLLLVPALLEMLASELIDILIDDHILPDELRGLSLEVIAESSLTQSAVIVSAIRNIIGPGLHSIVVGGAALDPRWQQVLSALGIELYLGYGMTEASPILTCSKATDCPPGSVGKALPNIELRLNDRSEILASGPNIMQGYIGGPAWLEAWFNTGDIGRIDEAGNVFIEGRSKEAMVSANGETIFPDEMEAYYQHLDFIDSCVVPLSSNDGNDIPTLVIYSHLDHAEVKKIINEMAGNAPERLRTRNYILSGHPLPRTELGKIQRRKLAAMFKEQSNEKRNDA